MIPRVPFWMVQRQVKGEPVGEDTLRLQAPQLPLYEIAVRQLAGDSAWTAALYRVEREGQERALVSESHPFPDPRPAWEAGFELYRQHVIT